MGSTQIDFNINDWDDDLESLDYDVFQEPTIKNLESHLRSMRDDLISDIESWDLPSNLNWRKISVSYRAWVGNFWEDLIIRWNTQDDDIDSLLDWIDITPPSIYSEAIHENEEDDLYYRSLGEDIILKFSDYNKDHLFLTVSRWDQILSYGHESYSGNKQFSRIALEYELEFMIKVMKYIKQNKVMNESRGNMQKELVNTIEID